MSCFFQVIVFLLMLLMWQRGSVVFSAMKAEEKGPP